MYIFTDETLRYLIAKIKSQIAPKSSLDNKVDKVDGKVLSDNDFTDSAKQVLETKYDSVRVENSTGKSNIIFSNESLDVKTIELKTGCDMFFYPKVDETLRADLNGNVVLPYAFISKSGNAIGNITVNINNLTTGTNTSLVFEVVDGKNNEIELQGFSAGDVKLTFTIEGDTEELKANVLGEYSTVIMLPLTVYRSTDSSLVPLNVSDAKTVVSDFGNGEYEIMLYTATSINYLNFSNVQTLTNIGYISDSITNMTNTYRNCRNLTGNAVCGNNVIDMVDTYYYCRNLTGNAVCGNNVTNMYYAYYYCYNLTGSPACGPNVTDMNGTYFNCRNLTGSPVCSDNVINMNNTYYNCFNLTGSPVCGDKVTDMHQTYYYCNKLTGSPACGDKVTTMVNTYRNCTNLTGSPVCGNNVTDMYYAYCHCFNLTGQPVCGDKVTNMHHTYYNCTNLTGSPVCGDNVTDMRYTYSNCYNLTGSPACGPNVTNMASTYYNCYNLTGSPVCGDNVTDMYQTYINCSNLIGNPVCGANVTSMGGTYSDCIKLTGSPVCGDKVSDMLETYRNCYSLTGSPVCGNNVTNMAFAYFYCNNLTGNPAYGNIITNMASTYAGCTNLTGLPICGNNVTNMTYTYSNCKSLGHNGYFFSNKISNVCGCFAGRNTQNRLNLYVPSTGVNSSHNTLSKCLISNTRSLLANNVSWTNDTANNHYYNTAYNIYIYPTSNVAQTYKDNELLVARYTMSSGANVIPEVDSSTITTMEDITNDDGTITRSVYLDESQAVEFPSSISFNGETDLLTVEKLKTENIVNGTNMFKGCSNFKGFEIDNPQYYDLIDVKGDSGGSLGTSPVIPCNSKEEAEKLISKLKVIAPDGTSSTFSISFTDHDPGFYGSSDGWYIEANASCGGLSIIAEYDYDLWIHFNAVSGTYDAHYTVVVEDKEMFIPDFSNIENATSMFEGCSSLEILDMSGFNALKTGIYPTDFTNFVVTESESKSMGQFNGLEDVEIYSADFQTKYPFIDKTVNEGVNDIYKFESPEGYFINVVVYPGDQVVIRTTADNDSEVLCLRIYSVTTKDICAIKYADYMFAGCSKLTKESFTNFELPNVESVSHIFDGCTNLL